MSSLHSLPVSEVQFTWAVIHIFVQVQLLFSLQTRLVRHCDTSHGHVGAVDDKDEDGEQTDHGTHHAEADDTSTPQVQLLYNVATQEGAPTSCWYHHIS